jgi:hypothetical protein
LYRRLLPVRRKPYGKARDAVDIPLKKVQFLPGEGGHKQGTLKSKLERNTKNEVFVNL